MIDLKVRINDNLVYPTTYGLGLRHHQMPALPCTSYVPKSLDENSPRKKEVYHEN